MQIKFAKEGTLHERHRVVLCLERNQECTKAINAAFPNKRFGNEVTADKVVYSSVLNYGPPTTLYTIIHFSN